MAEKKEKKSSKKSSSTSSSSSNKSSTTSTSRPSSGGASGDSSQTPSTKTSSSSSSSTPTRTRQAEVTTTNKDSKGNETSKTTTLNNDGVTKSSKSGSTTKKTTTADKITSTWDKLTNDTDGDGKTSFSEFAGNVGDSISDGFKNIGSSIVDGAKSLFEGKDFDGDGKKSVGEWFQHKGDQIQSNLGGVDYNQDNTIDIGETVRGATEESSFGENLKAFLGGNNTKEGGFWDQATTGIGAVADTVSTIQNPFSMNTARVADNVTDWWGNQDFSGPKQTEEEPKQVTSNIFAPKQTNSTNNSSGGGSDYDAYLLWLQNNPGKSYEEYKQAMSDKRLKDFVVRGMGSSSIVSKALNPKIMKAAFKNDLNDVYNPFRNK